MSEHAVAARVVAAEGLAAEAGFDKSRIAERLVTVERDEEPTRRAAGIFADDGSVSMLTGGWRLLEQHAPFDVFRRDGGGKRDDPGRVVEPLTHPDPHTTEVLTTPTGSAVVAARHVAPRCTTRRSRSAPTTWSRWSPSPW
ncbi:hypothetical protein ACFQ7I_36065, partial [Streptomyces massasporeus]